MLLLVPSALKTMAAVMLSPCPAGREVLPLDVLKEVLPPDVVLLGFQVVIKINPYGGDVVDAHAVFPQPLLQTTTNTSQRKRKT